MVELDGLCQSDCTKAIEGEDAEGRLLRCAEGDCVEANT